MKTFSSSAGYQSGGLGRHFAEMIESSRAAGELVRYYASAIAPQDAGGGSGGAGQLVRVRWLPWLCTLPPLRYDSGLRQHLTFNLFDRAVARKLSRAADCHVGFCGQSLHTFQAARRLGYRQFELVAPTCHLDYVARQHRRAQQQHPIERGWLNDAHRRKGIAEYAMADRIYVVSDYARQSFLSEGIAPARLQRVRLSADERFAPAPQRVRDGTFRIVFTGALSVAKGVPLLLDAFRAARIGPALLTLIGGTGSRGMRRLVEQRCAADSRIRVVAGDPLPHLQAADLYVHPSYQDGYPYAVLEAMACRVPVVVSEDTGTKELVREDVNGWVVPTGCLDALVAAIERARRRLS